MTQEFEYIDREHYNTICLGTFEQIPPVPDIPEDKWIGRRMIVPNYKDKESQLPVIMTIKGIACYHLQTIGYGSHRADLCFVETE